MRFRRQPNAPAPLSDPAEFKNLTPESQAAAHVIRNEYQALAERNAQLIRRFLTIFSVALAILATFLLVCGVASVVLLERSSTEHDTLKQDEQRLSTVQGRLLNVQHTLEVSQKASTKTRVVTVGQRCDLTNLILGVLDRIHDREDAAPFQASYQICMHQLNEVKQINAKTPTPTP